MQESEPDNPNPIKIDPNDETDRGELFEILTKLKTGDSVHFSLTASELFEKTFGAPRPDSIAAESKIKFQIGYEKQISESDYFDLVAEKQRVAAEKQLLIDTEILDEFLAENNIDAQQTESGLRYVITKEGTGEKPEAGQIVNVNYAGRLLDGTYFDTSVESVARENGIFSENRPGGYSPLSFQIGQGRVIKGWDEGIALLKKGSKATLYIPSSLGYGGRSSGPIIKPNSILVFDVELVDIEE